LDLFEPNLIESSKFYWRPTIRLIQFCTLSLMSNFQAEGWIRHPLQLQTYKSTSSLINPQSPRKVAAVCFPELRSFRFVLQWQHYLLCKLFFLAACRIWRRCSI